MVPDILTLQRCVFIRRPGCASGERPEAEVHCVNPATNIPEPAQREILIALIIRFGIQQLKLLNTHRPQSYHRGSFLQQF